MVSAARPWSSVVVQSRPACSAGCRCGACGARGAHGGGARGGDGPSWWSSGKISSAGQNILKRESLFHADVDKEEIARRPVFKIHGVSHVIRSEKEIAWRENKNRMAVRKKSSFVAVT